MSESLGNDIEKESAMTVIKEMAYAKINLYLDVLGIREDGYHEIKTVMHTVSLCDEITVGIADARVTTISLCCEGNPYLPQDGRNLAVKAADLFLNRLGKTAAVTIKLKKRIPVAAGLAGGSSDAAAVLRALNKLFRRPFTRTALCEIGSALGSDIPYCINGSTVLCMGRGEIMEPIAADIKLHTVIAIADEHVSTPEAYRTLDACYANFDGSVPTGGESCYSYLRSALMRGQIDPRGIFNAFERAILPLCPGALAIEEHMIKLGANSALMSGSGPSVFGIFPTSELAMAAQKRLCELGYTAFYAKSV
jgi:4-diphosphocytidyl-2-C-methyl-D-erythritol kinase